MFKYTTDTLYLLTVCFLLKYQCIYWQPVCFLLRYHFPTWQILLREQSRILRRQMQIQVLDAHTELLTANQYINFFSLAMQTTKKSPLSSRLFFFSLVFKKYHACACNYGKVLDVAFYMFLNITLVFKSFWTKQVDNCGSLIGSNLRLFS